MAWQLVGPFGIDDGELEGLTTTQSFCLGVEFALIYRDLDHRSSGDWLIHPENAVRLESL